MYAVNKWCLSYASASSFVFTIQFFISHVVTPSYFCLLFVDLIQEIVENALWKKMEILLSRLVVLSRQFSRRHCWSFTIDLDYPNLNSSRHIIILFFKFTFEFIARTAI